MANLEVNLIGDSRSLERAFARSARSADQFHKKITRAAGGVAAAFGVGFGFKTLVDGLKSITTSASNLAESMSKTDAVFGSSAAAITDWSKTTALAFGVSQRSALETASSFGALFAPLGVVGDRAAEQSQKLTELGADLASFYNTDVQSALDAIRSGLVGEAEPLRRYGALLTETRVTEEALAQTHKKQATNLTAQEKVLARIALIYRDTAVAQGDFARTSGGLAGQQKILGAQVDDLKTKLGEALLPQITEVVKKMNVWLSSTENQDELIGDFTTTVDTAATAFTNLAGAVQTAADAYKNLNKEAGRLEGFLDRIGAGINRETLFRVVPGTELIAQSIGTLLSDNAGRARPPKRPGGLLGSRFGDAATRAAGQPGAYSSMADAASRAIAATIKADKVPPTPAGAEPKGVSVTQRNRWFDAMISRQLGRVQDITSLKGQIARLDVIAGLVRARMAVTKDVTRRFALEDTLLDVLRERRGVRSALTDQMEQRAEDAKAAAKAAREAAAETKRLQTERKFDWIDFAVERAEATEKPGKIRAALRVREKALVALIRHEGFTLDRFRELWRTRKAISDLNKKNADTDPLAGLMQVSSKKMTAMLAAGTGLGVAGRHRLSANVSGMELRPIYVGVNVDGREIGRANTKDQARTSRRTSRQTSGYRG